MPDSRARGVRYFWLTLFGFALIVVAVATAYSLRVNYSYSPAFAELGLEYDVEGEDVRVGTVPRRAGEVDIPVSATIARIDGKPVVAGAMLGDLAQALQAAPGPSVSVDLRQPDGQLVELKQQRRRAAATRGEQNARNLRIAMRLGMGLFACSVLLICSLLLGLRRPEDPVAMLFAMIFALMAASVDPPVQLWLWTGLGWVEDVVASSWFYLLLIALAVFPDGVFVPRFLRWMIVAAIPVVVFASLPQVNATVQVLVSVGILLALLLGQAIRYRRCPPGIERQQIKWAAFGFGGGFILLMIAFIMVAFIPDDSSKQSPLFNLATLVLFSSGVAAIPLGLLVALTRFRLWEADTVITRSAAYAVVTLIVGVVWAASSDLVKLVITEVIGRESEAGATTVGAIIAAGIFAPTQSAVLGWTRKRFGGPMERIEGAAQRLKSWGLTETPAEVASRALQIIEEAVHPAQAAVLLDLSDGTELVAARNVTTKDDRRLLERLTLADEAGPVGELRLGRRSDGNRYNRQELEAVRQLIPHLADALRVARGRHSRESQLQRQIEAMAARLAQLEGGTPKRA
jgi:hypothetical protein